MKNDEEENKKEIQQKSKLIVIVPLLQNGKDKNEVIKENNQHVYEEYPLHQDLKIFIKEIKIKAYKNKDKILQGIRFVYFPVSEYDEDMNDWVNSANHEKVLDEIIQTIAHLLQRIGKNIVIEKKINSASIVIKDEAKFYIIVRIINCNNK